MATATTVRRQRGTRTAARFAWVVLGTFVLVVLWGAVVRATGSGGGCGSHWPLCNGFVNPLHHARLATIIEFTHRSTSGICTILLVGLAVWTFLTTPRHHPARRAVLWSLFFLVTEALLGAALVLRHWVEDNVSTGRTIAQSVHFTNTLLLMAALALTAWFLREDGERAPATEGTSAHGLPVALGAVFATVVVGATGSLAALADTLFPSPTLTSALAQDFGSGSPLLVRMRWLHPAAATVALVCVVLLIRMQRHEQRHWDGLLRAVAALLVLQFVLGIADVLLLAPTWMQVLHLLGADLYWVALVLLAARVLWPASRDGLDPRRA